jgi:hypothetical protein
MYFHAFKVRENRASGNKERKRAERRGSRCKTYPF